MSRTNAPLMPLALLALGQIACMAVPALAGSSGSVTRSENRPTRPLKIDTASEGYPCNNGVCMFPSGNIGASYSAPITSTGGSGPTPYNWSVVAGRLPAGLTLTPNYGVYSAYVYGTPTTVQTSAFTLQVRDGAGHTAQQAFTLTINSPAMLTITFPSSCCPAGMIGISYLQNFAASGGIQPYTWSIANGQLPPGLSLSPSPPASLAGTPTAVGTFTFSVRVTDSTGTHADQNGSMTIH